MADKRFLIGQRGKTGKGEFVVLRETHDGYLIQYISGEWEGKHLVMPREVGKTLRQSRVESISLSKPEMEKFLDMFYDDFKQEYNHVYYYRFSKDPTTKQMFGALREEYLPLFQLTLRRYFQSKGG